MMNYLTRIFTFIALVLVGIAIGYWVLISPDNPVLRVFRGEISDISANIITGPYPVEKDFARLAENKIEAVVSLLDPALPYEKELLDQERKLAQQYGMQFLNFPMSSILGQKFGDYYEQNANRAAELLTAYQGKVYLHCYLGVHRIGTVTKLLGAKQIQVARYTLQEGERSREAFKLDAAEAKFHEGDYEQAAKLLRELRAPTPAAVLLQAWVDYKLGDIGAARKSFTAAMSSLPSASDPRLGIAYCDYRENLLSEAKTGFSEVLAMEPGNVEALHGLGLVFIRENRPQDAADHFRKVLQYQPQHEEARMALQNLEANTKAP